MKTLITRAGPILACLVLVLGLCSAEGLATASSITLGASPSGTLTFAGASSATQITLNLGPGLEGSAIGTGSFSSSGSYDIGTNSNTLTETGATSTTSSWSVSGTESFCYTSASGCAGTNLLSGTLSLIDLFQVNQTGTFNTTLTANMSGLSGSLAGQFPSGAVVGVSIDFASSTNLATLLGQSSGTTLSANISSGEINPTPEPASMLLFGSGLLGLGSFLRRRLRA